MKIHFSIISFLFAFTLISAEKNSPWGFEWGISTGEAIPLSLLAGIRYHNFYFRGEGLGYRQNSENYWCGGRGSVGVFFFKQLPFHLEFGISSGYSYAKAPNHLHRAFNEANGAYYLYEKNIEETGDISLDAGTSLFGFHLRISTPVYYFTGNKKPKLLWRAGYLWNW